MVEIEMQKPWELPRAYESDLDSHLEMEDRVSLSTEKRCYVTSTPGQWALNLVHGHLNEYVR